VSYEDPMCLVVAAAASRDNDTDNDMEDTYIPEGELRTDLRRKYK
jgi:hypothetical protein